MADIGMLASAESIGIVADAFHRYQVTTSVVDPVCNMINTVIQANDTNADLNFRSWCQPPAPICFLSRQFQH